MLPILILADGITIHIGNNVWTIDQSFLIYLLVAAIVGVIAESIVGWRLPFGIVGAIIVALLGIWLMTDVIKIGGFTDYYVANIPLIRAFIGALILTGLWHALTYNMWRDRRRYYRRDY